MERSWYKSRVVVWKEHVLPALGKEKELSFIGIYIQKPKSSPLILNKEKIQS